MGGASLSGQFCDQFNGFVELRKACVSNLAHQLWQAFLLAEGRHRKKSVAE
jgi:hypothetical protein